MAFIFEVIIFLVLISALVGSFALGLFSLFFVPIIFFVIMFFMVLMSSGIFYFIAIVLLFMLLTNILYKFTDIYIHKIKNRKLLKSIITFIVIVLFLMVVTSHINSRKTIIEYKEKTVVDPNQGIAI